MLAQLKLKGTAASTAPTNEQGEAEFTNLAPGIYELMVSKEGYDKRRFRLDFDVIF